MGASQGPPPPFERTVSAEDLARLKHERETADMRYNEALTALDGAVQRLRDMPHPPPAYDEHQITPLNERWDLLSGRPAVSGWRGRVQSLIWSLVGPLFEQQHAFNSLLVDHLNRNVSVHREVTASATSAIAVVTEELARTIEFQTRLVQFVQGITPYVDTKDREVSALMRRINEDIDERGDSLSRRVAGLAGTVEEVATEIRKRSESALSRERRLESRVDDLRSTSAVAHRLGQTLKRELERLRSSAGGEGGRTPLPPSAAPMTDSSHSTIDSYKYVGFEDEFRGSPDDIRERLKSYLPYFQGATGVLDAGCGRGEFLELLRDDGIDARGIDLNHEMVEECRARGLTVDEGDLLSHLVALPDESLGGLFAAQVGEHLEPDYLLGVLDAAFHKLRPGAKLILETINVASWSAFFQSYVRDITHARPLHPETLKYLVSASGFQKVDVSFRSPCPDQNRLEAIPPLSQDDFSATPTAVANLVVAFNENVEKLNRLLFADQDYAVIADRP